MNIVVFGTLYPLVEAEEDLAYYSLERSYLTR